MGITIKKRISLFQYNLKMKRELGLYDPLKEQQMINEKNRSMNLFDFRTGKVGDYYLLDEFSDASEFGGESEMRMGLMEDPKNTGIQTCK
jgi:hypothetical protein